ncbi:MAG: aminotransferase class I/II-fold pyridoxal phosphate-dependent enzyme [Verrucomicrobia bacterium]|nr:aminotransferase class I/II-fold pyridoxal phosphate-dependent enzyme [Verrucomicrobiota bacterium]
MKEDSVLATLGGQPAFTQPLHVGRPNITNRERFLELTGQLLDGRWLTNNGPLVREFEQRIAAFLGVKHCICVCNATIGLEIATRAAGLKGEVIVPSYTFIATSHALQWQEITPVFSDVDPATHNLDPAQIEEHITPRTSAIIGTHVWGRPCPVEALAEIAQRRGLKLMFDAAHAFGCSHRGRMIGGFGLAEVFSFHATKFLNSFEGGAITTNDDELAAKIRLMTNFGFSGYDNVVYIGTNGKMTEVCAAMGLTNLECFADLVAVNRRNHDAYRAGVQGISGLSLLHRDPAQQSNYQYVVVEVDTAQAGLSRDELIQVLHAENVLARKYFWPGCHRMEPYRSLYPYAGLLLPETERVAARVVVLPTGTAVGVREVQTVCQVIATALCHAGEVKAALNARAGSKLS